MRFRDSSLQRPSADSRSSPPGYAAFVSRKIADLFRTWRPFRNEIELALPINKLQPADSAKFPRVVSDKRQIMLKSNRSYLQIVRSDQMHRLFPTERESGHIDARRLRRMVEKRKVPGIH